MMQAIVSKYKGMGGVLRGEDAVIYDIGANYAVSTRTVSAHEFTRLIGAFSKTNRFTLKEEKELVSILLREHKKARAEWLFEITSEEIEDRAFQYESAEVLNSLLQKDVWLEEYLRFYLSNKNAFKFSALDLNAGFEANRQLIERVILPLRQIEAQLEELGNRWEQIPDDVFGGAEEKCIVEEEIVQNGGQFGIAMCLSKGEDISIRRIELQRTLAHVQGIREILNQWLAGLTKKIKRELEAEKSGREITGYGRKEAPKVHEIFKIVEKQQSEIVGLLRKGDVDRARKLVDELVAFQSEGGERRFVAMTLCKLAQEAKLLKKFDMHLELTLRAVDIYPEDGRAWGQLADAYLHSWKEAKALEALERARSLGQEQFAWTGKARIHWRRGELQEALDIYRDALGIWPTEPVIRNSLAEVLKELGEFSEAKAMYDESIEIAPYDIISQNGRANLYKEMGQLKEAKLEYERIKNDFGDDIISIASYSDVHRISGEFNQALVIASGALERYPGEPVLLEAKANALSDAGRNEEAIRTFDEMIAIQHFDPNPWAEKARALAKHGNFELADAVVNQAIQKFPTAAILRNTLPWILQVQGKWTEALAIYEQNIQRHPRDFFAAQGRAKMLKELGRKKEALDAFGKLLSAYPTNRRLALSVAALHISTKNYSAADTILGTRDPVTKNDWHGQYLRGMLILRTDGYLAAKVFFESLVEKIPFVKEKQYFKSALGYIETKLGNPLEALQLLAPESDNNANNIVYLHALAELGRSVESNEIMRKISQTRNPFMIGVAEGLLNDKVERRDGAEWGQLAEEEFDALVLAA